MSANQQQAQQPDNALPPIGRLRWRTRRGQRELDLILQRYLEARYPQASIVEQQAFALLLEQSDPDILDWVLGRVVPPAELSDVVRALTARD
ncbi:MAG: succinate dehydrogenase assembly factor 2 [Gammaproteobacteria bacterium]